jgi:circadian clock protein KaiC
MNSAPELMSTGIPGLDQLLGGGLIRGNSLLIEGPPGSGKIHAGPPDSLRGGRPSE